MDLNTKFCGHDDHDVDDDVPLSQSFPQILSKCDGSDKKRDSMFGNPDSSLHVSVKKSKLSPHHHHGEGEDEDEDDLSFSKKLTDKSFSSLKKDLTLLEELFVECKWKQKLEEKRLQSIKRDTEQCCKELQNKKNQVSVVRRIDQVCDKVQEKTEECIKEFVVKEDQLYLMENMIGERKLELKAKEIELNQVIDKDRERKEEELKALSQQIAEFILELKAKEIELDTMNKLIGTQAEKLESEKENGCAQIKELESMKKQLECQVNKLESEKKNFEGRIKDIESREKQFEGQMKEFQLKEEEFEGKVKEIKSKKEELKGQVKEFESKKKKFEERMKEHESKENEFKVKMNELKLKEKQFERQDKDPDSKLNKLDGQMKEPKLTGKQYEALRKYIDEEQESVASYMDDRLSHTIGGTSLQLDTSEKTVAVESHGNNMLVNPAKVVLDIIHKPINPLCKKGDNAVIFYDSRIFLLEQLMRVSPNIEDCVREEALSLALDLKAYIRENTEDSVAVLGFLLLLSIYGLLTSFDEDEILELFALVAQHKIAMEMFRALGFANIVSDFVENLIKRKQFVVAVRFSCAYNLADKTKQVDLLQQHIQNAKLICANSCKKTNSIEIKDKARDQEIASLETVQQCISDCRLQSEVLENEIGYRMLELQAHKGK